jgi:pyruvate, orthophosphate dikinase
MSVGSASGARVYAFEEGSSDMRDLLGGKGANLAGMSRLGLRVPQGFTITTAACMEYLALEGMPPGLWDEVLAALGRLEERAGRRFGAPNDPLLLSVRSGGRESMPGMMDTILNLGLRPASVEGLARRTGRARFAHDCHRRLVQMFGSVVAGIPDDTFEEALRRAKSRRGTTADADLTAEDLADLAGTFRGIYREATGEPFPDDPIQQLEMAVRAVFASWNGRRARDYRRAHGIPDDLGTAVNIQQMVFGNSGPRSATGVAFTRDLHTGERGAAFGEFLMDAQGEDVVAGVRTPRPLAELADELPEAFAELQSAMDLLERSHRDMQDVEFTIDDGVLYMLQTRDGKRSADAMVRIAVDMVDEGLVDEREALRRLVDPGQVRLLLLPRLDRAAAHDPIAHGVAASPGAASGAIALSADAAAARAAAGEDVILVRDETTPDDFHGMAASRGILTARGGRTSHAAVVAVGMGVPAVCGVAAVRFPAPGTVDIGGTRFAEGDLITVDGTDGDVYAGRAPVTAPEADNPALTRILEWADRARTLGVRANADTPADAERARRLGAEGIGLCRTEHMFGGERAHLVRDLLLAGDPDEVTRLTDELRRLQTDDFRGILRTMTGLPVTVRLLDPPLHEFLPNLADLMAREAVARATGAPDPEVERYLEPVRAMHEANPMLGLRGCRLGIERPGLYRMQVEALMEAACDIAADGGPPPRVEIMVPLVGFAAELEYVGGQVRDAADAVLARRGVEVRYGVGTMIELPRACLAAGEIAHHADFFSFGTNDLTQTTLGLSRDDAETGFLPTYLERGILPADPFATIDREGVGALVRMAVERGRAARPSIALGVCGEHGGDPASVAFFHGAGLDYVSCSPYRVQTARIAAARAALAAG